MKSNARFVIDSNIIVSALLFPQSVARQAFNMAVRHGTILISMPILAEMEEVLSRKRFDTYLTKQERTQFLENFVANAHWVDIIESITLCRDRKDDKFLELAVNGRAECIISGDNDLLDLDPFRGIRIQTPRAFVDMRPPALPPSPRQKPG